MDFTPTKFSKVSIYWIKKQVNLLENVMIQLISCPANSQYIKKNLRQINIVKLLKVKISFV